MLSGLCLPALEPPSLSHISNPFLSREEEASTNSSRWKLTADLREHYNPADERYDERYAPLPPSAPTPASPPDSTVPIPSSLAALATPAPDAPYLAPLPPMDDFPGAAETVALDRGEMGGKRRKAPHERAGWKEILEEEERQKAEAAQQAQQVSGQPEEAKEEDQYGSKMKRAKLR